MARLGFGLSKPESRSVAARTGFRWAAAKAAIDLIDTQL
jgi:hypothetical protein